MAKLLPGLLVSLMALQTLQEDGRDAKIRRKIPPGLGPKTFNGTPQKSNHTNQPPALLQPNTKSPRLHVRPEDPAAAYTSGVLSTRVIPSFYTLAMAVGIPSNVYILAFLKVRAKSLSTAVLYLSLALSDLLLLLSLALRVHYHLSGNNWIFGEMACRIVTAFFYGNVYCSAHTIACISLKRYLAVVRPFLYRRLPKMTLAVVTCLGVWALFGAAVVPELLVRQSYHLPQLGVTTCHDVLPLEETSHALLIPYRLILVCLGFVVPFLTCICAHVAVVYHLGRSGCNWRPFVRVTTLVLLIFMVCFSPSGILHIAHYICLFSSGDDRLYGYYRVAVCLCCFHSCLDPFLCVLMSKTAASKLQFISLRRTPQRLPVIIQN
ncbi:proteinase-activated receptor 3 [Myripristis murdjan]|uniref:proteinase-activated receptor 3 n=1 Tax=Myripristis murdjan TaxID=586833 RepID=UPI001175C9E2|nr:proteinase-activated receptor 3-like [Myripristis murdjan]